VNEMDGITHKPEFPLFWAVDLVEVNGKNRKSVNN
jgi:hypothetical protein